MGTNADHTVVKLWIRDAPRGNMLEQEQLTLEADAGIVGDYCHGKHRHVTIVFADDWSRAESELGREVDPAGRRANVLVTGGDGLRLEGRRVRIGDCLLDVRGETKPCDRMEDAAVGLRDALVPEGRAGVWGRVLEGGTIRGGDTLVVEEAVTT